ncbi:hypothetical protein QBC37DRAFT_403633 [Rhypophila decipiens]|uniref:Uncharacterized protein n=1 Tax=Rhypophila decipiens TaxID=261697 RepID=A0AAN6Y060_9PEZI|nr:hypothetical protein QBC37DRAFT_403633 [Rhypophila decipiens]
MVHRYGQPRVINYFSWAVLQIKQTCFRRTEGRQEQSNGTRSMARFRITANHCLKAQAGIRILGWGLLIVALLELINCEYNYGEALNFDYAFVITLIALSTMAFLRILHHLNVIRFKGALDSISGFRAETQCLGLIDMLMIILAVLGAVITHELDLYKAATCDVDDPDCQNNYYEYAQPTRDRVIWLLTAFAALIAIGIMFDFAQSWVTRNSGRSDNIPLVPVESHQRELRRRRLDQLTTPGEAVSVPEPVHAVDSDPTITDGYMGSPRLLAMRGTGNPVGARS